MTGVLLTECPGLAFLLRCAAAPPLRDIALDPTTFSAALLPRRARGRFKTARTSLQHGTRHRSSTVGPLQLHSMLLMAPAPTARVTLLFISSHLCDEFLLLSKKKKKRIDSDAELRRLLWLRFGRMECTATGRGHVRQLPLLPDRRL